MDSPAGFPGKRGETVATANVAALISALTLPAIERFATDSPWLAGLPDFAPFADPSDGAESPRLTKVEVARAVIDECVAALAALKALTDSSAACQAAVIERLAAAAAVEASALAFDAWQRDISGLAARAEVATTLVISEGAAGALIAQSTTLVQERPATWERLNAGDLSWGHAVVIAEETGTLRAAGIDDDAIADYEQSLLAKAAGCPLPSFRGKARRLRERSHPESIDARTRHAYAGRRLAIERGRDGMSWLNLYLPAPTAECIWDQCTLLARSAQGPAEARTLAQLRLDIAAALLLCQTLAENHIHPTLPTRVPGPADAVYHADYHADPGGVPGRGPAFVPGPEPAPDGPDRPDGPDPEDHFREDAGNPVREDGGLGDPGFDERGDPWEYETLPGGTSPGAGYPVIPSPETLPVSTGPDTTLPGSAPSGAVGLPEAAGTVPAFPPMPRVLPIITIPMLSLLGLGNTPAELEGYGPISLDVARRLTAHAPSFLTMLTDPVTGEALALNPQSRRVSKKMRAFLRSRDEYCQFPGCTEKAVHADYDHLTAWEKGGRTTAEGTEPLCRKHHKLKHFTDDRTSTGRARTDQSPDRAAMRLRGWTPRMTGSGRPGWTSPTGRYLPPEPRDVRAPSYPKWLMKRINRTLAAAPAPAPAPTGGGRVNLRRVNLGPVDLSPVDLSPAEAFLTDHLRK
ncbi:DUF222 domain-containing protein [Specibacter sp. RAF43]|uniref:HNH endonuclease signature motif containing protein n=1 Tax=Specibacter sp. RAF43 TaxID=3233057 RepID=UPI003F9CCA3F